VYKYIQGVVKQFLTASNSLFNSTTPITVQHPIGS